MNRNVGLVKKVVLSSLAHGAQRVATRAEDASERKWEIRRKLVVLAPCLLAVTWLFEMLNINPGGTLQLISSLLFLGSFVGWLYLWNDRRGESKYTRVWTFAEIGLVRVVLSMWIWSVPKLFVVPVTLFAAYLFTKRPKKSDDDDES